MSTPPCRPRVYTAQSGRPYAVGCNCAGWYFNLPPQPTRVDRRHVGRVIRRQWRRHVIEDRLLACLPGQLAAMVAALERVPRMFGSLSDSFKLLAASHREVSG